MRSRAFVSGLLQRALSGRRRIRPYGGVVGTKERRVHLPAVVVISPGDARGSEIPANNGLALGVEVSLFDLVTLGVIGAGDASGSQARAFGRATVMIEIGFDDFQPASMISSRIGCGAGSRDRLGSPARGMTFGFHGRESEMKFRRASDRKTVDDTGTGTLSELAQRMAAGSEIKGIKPVAGGPTQARHAAGCGWSQMFCGGARDPSGGVDGSHGSGAASNTRGFSI